MNFEMPQVNKENSVEKDKYENRIKEIKETLTTQGYSKELDLEFVELWRNMPDGISNETHDNIDEIRNLLIDTAPEKE